MAKRQEVWVRFSVPAESEPEAEDLLRMFLENPNLYWEQLKSVGASIFSDYEVRKYFAPTAGG